MNPPMRFWSCLSTTGLIQCHPHSNTLHYVLKHRIHFMRRGSTFRINPKYRTPQYEPTHQEDVTGPQLSIARRVQSSPVADARFPFNDELEQRALRRELQDLVEKPEGSYDRKWTLAPTGRNIEKLFIFEHSQQSLVRLDPFANVFPWRIFFKGATRALGEKSSANLAVKIGIHCPDIPRSREKEPQITSFKCTFSTLKFFLSLNSQNPNSPL